jgi:hypothetical protein
VILQFRHYRVWGEREIVRGFLPCPGWRAATTSKRCREGIFLEGERGFLNFSQLRQKNRKISNRSKRLFIEEMISLAVGKLLMA